MPVSIVHKTSADNKVSCSKYGFYLNKEKVARFNYAKSGNTLVKVPPGQHEIVYVEKHQGVAWLLVVGGQLNVAHSTIT